MDVDFVRKSVKAIGQCAIKVDSSAERCVNVLLDLISTRVSYVVQEAVVVMKVGLSPPQSRKVKANIDCIHLTGYLPKIP